MIHKRKIASYEYDCLAYLEADADGADGVFSNTEVIRHYFHSRQIFEAAWGYCEVCGKAFVLWTFSLIIHDRSYHSYGPS